MSRKQVMFDRLTSAMCEQVAERFIDVMWDLKLGDVHQRTANDRMGAIFGDVIAWTKVDPERVAIVRPVRSGRPSKKIAFRGGFETLQRIAYIGGVSTRTLRERLKTMTPEAAVALGPQFKKAHA